MLVEKRRWLFTARTKNLAHEPHDSVKIREFSLGDSKAYVQEKRCAITENKGSRILSKK
jgi:hypothetical protein